MKKKINGYTLIELIFAIALISIILFALTSVVFTSNLYYKSIEEKFEEEMNVDFALEYLINEINSADFLMIKNVSTVRGDSQLGLILVTFNKKTGKDKYSFTTYILRNKEVSRVNFKGSDINQPFYESNPHGRNSILGNVNSFSTNISEDNKSIIIKLSTENKDYTKVHSIRNVIIKWLKS